MTAPANTTIKETPKWVGFGVLANNQSFRSYMFAKFTPKPLEKRMNHREDS